MRMSGCREAPRGGKGRVTLRGCREDLARAPTSRKTGKPAGASCVWVMEALEKWSLWEVLQKVAFESSFSGVK